MSIDSVDSDEIIDSSDAVIERERRYSIELLNLHKFDESMF